MALTGTVAGNSAQEARRPARLARGLGWTPWALALLFVLNSLRSLPCGNPIDTDAARHSMNGAFVHDLVKSGEWAHPVRYGKEYYSRLPGLSLPYHPPLFPVIESAFFFLFGVNLAAARLAVSIAVGICVLLLYRLVLVTHRSHAVAAAAVLVFFSWRWAQIVSSDVMLEMPALAFALGALLVIARADFRYESCQGLAFALLAGAAVWTKQTTVFLGAVPFVLALLTRKWKLLRARRLWISSAVFVAMVLAITLLSSRFAWTGVKLATQTRHIRYILLRNLFYYASALTASTTYVVVLLAAAAVILAVLGTTTKRQTGHNALYFAWTLSALAVIFVMAVRDERYLFFVIAPLAVILCAMLERIGQVMLGPPRAWLVPVGIAVVLAGINLAGPAPFLRGPSEAALAVADGTPSRIMYCGRTNGAFIFRVRSLDPQIHSTVIRGERLPRELFTPAGFEDFAHRFGINFVVLERTSVKRAWDGLFDSPAHSMTLIREVPLSSSDPLANGLLRVYRFTNPSRTPEPFKLHVWRIHEDLEVKF